MPQPASAHAFAQRYDLPLPLGFYLAGAGLAVALSFLGAFLAMRPGRLPRLYLDIPVPDTLSRLGTCGLKTVAFMLLLAVVLTGLFGPQSPTRNFATVFVWVIWWVGFALFTALIADLWSAGNPFRLVIDGILRLAGAGRRSRALPACAGWLAVAGLLGIAWLELVSDAAEEPQVLVGLICTYMALLLAGAALAWAPAWFSAADPLTRLFGLLGQVAPLAARPGAIRLRLPATGLVGQTPGVAGTVFVITLIAIVLFDGLSETPLWAAILDWATRSQRLRPLLLDLRAAGLDILKLIRTVGLLATVTIAVLLYLGLAAATWSAAGRRVPFRIVFTGFAGSLLPIAVAYHMAHYASYLALAGQLIVPIASDPLGQGWDLFGGANSRVDLGVIGARQTWWIAFVALVAGHGLSVFVAHAEALRLYRDYRLAMRSQLPMAAFMVGLSALSLWILAQPIVA